MTPYLADMPQGPETAQDRPETTYDAELAAAQPMALTDHEIARLKQALASSLVGYVNSGCGYGSVPAPQEDDRLNLFYSISEMDNVRRSLDRNGHADVAYYLEEAIAAATRKWFETRQR